MDNEWKRELRTERVAKAIEEMELPQGEPFVVLRTKEGKLAGRGLKSYEELYLLAEVISKKIWPDGSYEYVLPSVQSYFQIFCSDSKEGEQLREAMTSSDKMWPPMFACREMILADFGENAISRNNAKKLKITLEEFIDPESLEQIGSSALVMEFPDISEWEPQPGRIVLYPNATKKPDRLNIENHGDLWFSEHDAVKTSIDFSSVLGTLADTGLFPKNSSLLIESGHVDRGNRSLNKGTRSYHLEVFISPENGYRTSWKDYNPNAFCLDTVFNCYPNVAQCVALERIPRR